MSRFKAYIEKRVNSKQGDYQHDDTRVDSFLKHRSGEKFYFNGDAGTTEIELVDAIAAVIIIGSMSPF